MDIRVIIKVHELIEAERTGTPKELSNKLGLSVRTVFNYINFMKLELNAPITFNTQTKNYYYERKCELCFNG
ncbi:HTH domain-containing protein [Flavobacterium capsici]|uniref:HTH domain-containing protein n=1 Tax=Flavobacterium capsici TaxID=3075618 RepID=A0AA96EXZ5_9FLAO|nr:MULTISPECIES: HTH domain-containing protein [unclassified Flavobacterium]WNM19127.1 HTH domain-containing protein [Flavobacterium sp. PMR2A8]WNM20516.1 HTH domain-containing protein [Flavobacterium sp. PMTSA4]